MKSFQSLILILAAILMVNTSVVAGSKLSLRSAMEQQERVLVEEDKNQRKLSKSISARQILSYRSSLVPFHPVRSRTQLFAIRFPHSQPFPPSSPSKKARWRWRRRQRHDRPNQYRQ